MIVYVVMLTRLGDGCPRPIHVCTDQGLAERMGYIAVTAEKAFATYTILHFPLTEPDKFYSVSFGASRREMTWGNVIEVKKSDNLNQVIFHAIGHGVPYLGFVEVEAPDPSEAIYRAKDIFKEFVANGSGQSSDRL